MPGLTLPRFSPAQPRLGPLSTAATATHIHGACAPGFERVRHPFAANFEKDLEVAASFGSLAVADLEARAS